MTLAAMETVLSAANVGAAMALSGGETHVH